MSYCRFSTNDYQCDVYVYSSVGDFIAIHVASNRQTPDTPPPPSIGHWWSCGEQGIADYMDRQRAVEAWLNTAERKTIGLPYDGETLQATDEADAAEQLEMLRDLGYIVPQYVIDTLKEEAGNV